jgi:hypothetical protein
MSNEGLPLSTLAIKAGMDVKTARKYLKSRRLPSQMRVERTWRTREDPFAEIWPEIDALLKDAPGLQVLTVFQELQRRYPTKFQDGQPDHPIYQTNYILNLKMPSHCPSLRQQQVLNSLSPVARESVLSLVRSRGLKWVEEHWSLVMAQLNQEGKLDPEK